MNRPLSQIPRIYSGSTFAVEEIVVARALLHTNELSVAVGALRLAFDSRNEVEVKLACERIRDAAANVERGAGQIKSLAGVLVNSFTSHLNRRTRT